MALVFGPLMSLDASGTIADAITFSKWKGRNYVRERVIPSNPQSGPQVGRRAMFKFLTQIWKESSASEQAGFQDLADQLVASRFNAYLSYNMHRWHNFLAPSRVYPATEANPPSDNDLQGAVWTQNRIEISMVGTTLATAWGYIIFASLTDAFTTAVGNAIIANPDLTIAAHSCFWTPPSVATWHFNIRTFSTTGQVSAEGTEQSAAP